MPTVRAMKYISIVIILIILAPGAGHAQGPVEAMVKQASAAKEAGRFDEAIGILSSALAIDPKSDAVLVALGRTYGAKGDFKQAKSVLEKAVQVNPGSADAHRFLGLVYGKLGDMKKAIAEAKRGTELEPKLIAGHQLLAELHLAAGQFKDAIKTEQEILRLDPKNAEAHLAIAMANRGLKKTAEAVKFAKKASELAPKEVAPLLTLATLYAEQKKAKQATDTLRQAERLANGAQPVMETIAATYALVGAGEETLRIYKELVAKHPKSAGLRLQLAKVLFLSKKIDDAKAEADKAAELEPQSGEPPKLLGLIAAAKGDAATAEKELRKSMAKNPKDLEIRVALGEILAKSGKFDEAIKEIEAVIKAEPKAEAGLAQGLCQLYRQHGKVKDRGRDVCLKACKAAGVSEKDCDLP